MLFLVAPFSTFIHGLQEVPAARRAHPRALEARDAKIGVNVWNGLTDNTGNRKAV
jgi:hypothetical protein